MNFKRKSWINFDGPRIKRRILYEITDNGKESNPQNANSNGPRVLSFDDNITITRPDDIANDTSK